MQSTLFITLSRHSGKPTRYFKGEKMMLVYRFPTFTLGILAVLHGEIFLKKTRRGSSLHILKGKQLRHGTLIKKRLKFSSFIRIFRGIGLLIYGEKLAHFLIY
jgi:hypothetical protein